MWWMAAAMAAPMIADMLMPKPSTPGGAYAPSAANPNMMKYQNQMLDSAFNPNGKAFQMASNNATNQVNANMARLGLGRSSMGIAAQQGVQSNLANQWQEEAARNQAAAMAAANQETATGNQLNEFNATGQNNAAMQAYNAAMMQRMNLVKGIGGAASMGAYMNGAGMFDGEPEIDYSGSSSSGGGGFSGMNSSSSPYQMPYAG